MLKRISIGFILAFMAISQGFSAELLPQTNDAQGVKITVIPQSLSAENWEFELSLETHARPLNDDLAKASVLIAADKHYPPLDWQGSPPGGHHRKGVLNFKPISPQPRSIELQIRLSGEPAPRKFIWLLEDGDRK